MPIPVKVLTEKRRLEKKMQKTPNPGEPFKDFRSFLKHFREFPEMAQQFLRAAGLSNLLEFLQKPGGIEQLLSEDSMQEKRQRACFV